MSNWPSRPSRSVDSLPESRVQRALARGVIWALLAIASEIRALKETR